MSVFDEIANVVSEGLETTTGVLKTAGETIGTFKTTFQPKDGGTTAEPVTQMGGGSVLQSDSSAPTDPIPETASLVNRIGSELGLPIWSVFVIGAGVTLLVVAAMISLFKKLF